jgi:hypothetical protein
LSLRFYSHGKLNTWTQNRCIGFGKKKCGRFLGRHQQKRCAECKEKADKDKNNKGNKKYFRTEKGKEVLQKAKKKFELNHPNYMKDYYQNNKEKWK